MSLPQELELPDVEELEIDGDIPALVALLKHQSSRMTKESAMALANLSNFREDLRPKMVKLGAVEDLIKLLGDPFPLVKEAALAALASLCGGDNKTKDHIACAGAIPEFVKYAKNSVPGICRWATEAIANLADTVDNDIKDQLKKARAIPGLIKLLKKNNEQVVEAAMRGLQNLEG